MTLWTEACQPSLSFTISWCLLRFTSLELVMLSNDLILCCPLFFLPSIFPSIRVFSNELALCVRWPKYWNFSFSPSNEYSELIYFRIDWFDLAVQRVLQRNNQWLKVKVIQSCPTLWDPMDCSTPGLLVLHYLLEFAQTHVH